MSTTKTWHLGHVPGTVIVDKVELDALRALVEVARAHVENPYCTRSANLKAALNRCPPAHPATPQAGEDQP